jgi:hypothetical protein
MGSMGPIAPMEPVNLRSSRLPRPFPAITPESYMPPGGGGGYFPGGGGGHYPGGGGGGLYPGMPPGGKSDYFSMTT